MLAAAASVASATALLTLTVQCRCGAISFMPLRPLPPRLTPRLLLLGCTVSAIRF